MNQPNDSVQLIRAVESVVESWPPFQRGSLAPISVIERQPVTGGCISAAERFGLDNGQIVFVKSSRDRPGLFDAESAGLAAIRATRSIHVPAEIGRGTTESGMEFLVLEWVDTVATGKDFEIALARSLAKMHRQSRNSRFGFPTDNFLGRTHQGNRWSADWVEFWAVQRIGFQLELANSLGYATPDFNRLCHNLIGKLDSLISTNDPASLIHGDLWSGNFLCGRTCGPVVIDPAAYFGSRESEFGMTTLFGGLGPRFYDAYHECWPLVSGWEERVEIYRLYHLMNHLNLFGTSYYESCLEILTKFS